MNNAHSSPSILTTALFLGKTWTEKENNQLYNFVLMQKIFDWNHLSELLKIEANEVKWHWQKVIYPQIKSTQKIAGSYKWSKYQDQILNNFQQKYSKKWELILAFLPDRSIFSIQSRWKRINSKRAQCKIKINIQQEASCLQSTCLFNDTYDYRKNVISNMNQKFNKKPLFEEANK